MQLSLIGGSSSEKLWSHFIPSSFSLCLFRHVVQIANQTQRDEVNNNERTLGLYFSSQLSTVVRLSFQVAYFILTGPYLCRLAKQSVNLLGDLQVDNNSFINCFKLPGVFWVLTGSGGLPIPAKVVSVFWTHSHLLNLAPTEVVTAGHFRFCIRQQNLKFVYLASWLAICVDDQLLNFRQFTP